MPSRDQIAGHRLSRPFAGHLRRDDLWRFTRRSVPRGVAIGLFVGILVLVPGIQIIGATLVSLPFRANIPVAAAMTFLTNPLTTPFLLIGAGQVGGLLGYRIDIAGVKAMLAGGTTLDEWAGWFLSDAALGLVNGLLLIASLGALAGYFVSIFVWRWWTGRKWRQRRGSASIAGMGSDR